MQGETELAREGDLQLGPDGRWRVFHKMVGAGHQPQWVYSPEMDDWLRSQRVTRVEGSGANMKLYGAEDDLQPIIDLRDPRDFRAFATIYNEQFDESGDDLGQRAAEQGAGVNIKDLWGQIYPDIDFPSLARTNFNGVPIEGTVDMEQFTGVIEAMEARGGDLSRYGFNKDADYQVIPLGDE